jgi:integrase
LVHMAKPWKHKNGTYYLYGQIPELLRPEFGGQRFVKTSLRTKDPVEAPRLFITANAELEKRFEAARAALAKAAELDEISSGRAAAIVDEYLKQKWPGDRWPSLWLTFWLEEAAGTILGTAGAGIRPGRDHNGVYDFTGLAGEVLAGDIWLKAIRELPRVKWMKAALPALDPLFASAEPSVVRTEGNERALMDAFNARIQEDNARLHADSERPRLPGSTPRLKPDLRLRELLKKWAKAQAPQPQSVHEASVAVEDLIHFLGDVPVMTVTGDMIYDYRDEARKLPRSIPRADRALPFRERVAKHEKSEGPRVSAATLKKRLGAIQTLIGFAYKERWVSQNVATQIHISGYSRLASVRRSFRHDELHSLFASDLFLKPSNWFEGKSKVSDLTLFWLFLLGLTSGARLEEVGQAHLADVKEDDGVVFIDIEDRIVEQTGLTGVAPLKSLKNEGSRRVVPVHPRVLALGFVDYCNALRKLGQTMLFPDLKANQFGKYTKEASRRANRVINKHASADSRLVFHRLRHPWICAHRDFDWAGEGHAERSQAALLAAKGGLFYSGHRAATDAWALAMLISMQAGGLVTPRGARWTWSISRLRRAGSSLAPRAFTSSPNAEASCFGGRLRPLGSQGRRPTPHHA